MTRAPDLAEPVVAFRAWRVVDGDLLSPYIPCRWDGPVMHAECYPANRALLFGRGWLAEPHDPPHPECRCGIYAYHRPGTQPYYGEFQWVDGIVSVWGRIESHRDGLRGVAGERDATLFFLAQQRQLKRRKVAIGIQQDLRRQIFGIRRAGEHDGARVHA